MKICFRSSPIFSHLPFIEVGRGRIKAEGQGHLVLPFFIAKRSGEIPSSRKSGQVLRNIF
jgi:hypothetical protein